MCGRDQSSGWCRDFRWPELKYFNWARDYFDWFALNNAQPALWLVQDDGSERALSFEELSQRSNRVASFLREHGVRRGDVVLMMLGSVIPLWEMMLAAIKLGAVLIPATSLLTAKDLQDRVARGNVRFVVNRRSAKRRDRPISQRAEDPARIEPRLVQHERACTGVPRRKQRVRVLGPTRRADVPVHVVAL